MRRGSRRVGRVLGALVDSGGEHLGLVDRTTVGRFPPVSPIRGGPFNGYDYKGDNFDNAETCQKKSQRRCVTLGIPPTADVANPAWGLPKATTRLAKEHVDGYLWVGRPWLFMQADPFVMERALDVARTTPYQ